ncbi:FYVE zinc finger [Dillenia turbinata]|uniref:FYVE zinc finger n=1 Tax=Dillenia turbinata TaxID=194707 RepID=A0AAN8Z4Z5_9MAGN
MADLTTNDPAKNVMQAILILKKGAYLLKYGRRGKPKFCPFRLSEGSNLAKPYSGVDVLQLYLAVQNLSPASTCLCVHRFLTQDETSIIWYADHKEKQLKLSHVSRILPGQRTAIFQRYPRPEKEYQSFSLLYSKRSLDVICKDKEEAEIWLVALRALISGDSYSKWRSESLPDSYSSDIISNSTRRSSSSVASSISSDTVDKDPGGTQTSPASFENPQPRGLVKAFSEVISCTASTNDCAQGELVSSLSGGGCSTVDSFRVSVSSAPSTSSLGSYQEDFDNLGDVYVWGGLGDGFLSGGLYSVDNSSAAIVDALLPKVLESTAVLDAQSIACGSRHAVLVTKQGKIFSWGGGSGGKLGHGFEDDVPSPKLISTLTTSNIELVACGEYHTCAVTVSGDLYTWGDGNHNFGLLGHGSDASHWTPTRVSGLEDVHISKIACGPWHTSAVTLEGQLFTFGEGTFGALGHGDHRSTTMPRKVETLKGLRITAVSCGAWHTAAVVEVLAENSGSYGALTKKLFTWGDGEKGQLGHGDTEPRLFPDCVSALDDVSFSQVACGYSITVALTASGQVYTMGSTKHGQLGCPGSCSKFPTCIEGNIGDSSIEEIACGSYHVAVRSSKAEIYTWGKGANGQLGHGDNGDRNRPTLVEALKDKQVKSVICGSNFTAAICFHKCINLTDHSCCSSCHNPFTFRRKRHNCYNCGLVFCKACSMRKFFGASLAPSRKKPYRVCDNCFTKLKRVAQNGSSAQPPKLTSGNAEHSINEAAEKETSGTKLSRQLSKLLSFNSRQADSRHPRPPTNLESRNSHDAPILGNHHRASFSGKTSASLPGSRTMSRSLSPVSRMPSTTHALMTSSSFSLERPEVTLDDPRKLNNLLQELAILRAQVEDSAYKSELLKAEAEKKSKQLAEATVRAEEEAKRNKAAKEVIKALTTKYIEFGSLADGIVLLQLKDISERVHKRSCNCGRLGLLAENTSSSMVSEQTTTNAIFPNHGDAETEECIIVANCSNETNEHSEKMK